VKLEGRQSEVLKKIRTAKKRAKRGTLRKPKFLPSFVFFLGARINSLLHFLLVEHYLYPL
jgi:hypothetical protein